MRTALRAARGVLLLILAALPGFGQGEPLGEHQRLMFTPRSAEVRELRRLYQQSGRVLPAAGFPLSAETLAELAQALAAESPDGETVRAAQDFLTRLDPDGLELSVWTRLNLEGYLHAGTPEVDVPRTYLGHLPLAELVLACARTGKAAILAEAFQRREYSTDYAPWNLPDSRPNNPIATENAQVARGYFWYDFDPLELQFGRDKVHFGPLRSSLLLSEALPFMDMLRLTLPLGPLTMDLMISTLESRQATPEDVTVPLGVEDDYGFGKTIILANLHRFEYDFGFLRAAVSGLCIYARPDNHIVLPDFFPVFSWHSADITPNNLSLIFDLEAVLFPGFRVMAQFGFDDINAQGVGLGDSDIPTIPAVIGGLEYTRPLPFGELALYGEAGYTHYLWGNFDNSAGEWALGRAIYRLRLDRGTRILPLTSPYGPGAIWAAAEAGFDGWRGLSARVFAELVFANPAADLIDTPYAESDAVRDTPREGRHRVGAELRWAPRPWLQVSLQPALYFGSDDPWFETRLALSAWFDGRWRLKEGARR